MLRTSLFALAFFVACGGQVTRSDNDSDGGIANDGSASTDSGSGGTCIIHASTYDQSCTSDSDCVGVFDGDVCAATCGCSNAAINRNALTKYDSDFPRTDGGIACPCPAGFVTCQNNKCAPCNDVSCFPGADAGRH